MRELEAEVNNLRQELGEAEIRHQKMYLQMFLKGQQAARLQADDEEKKVREGEWRRGKRERLCENSEKVGEGQSGTVLVMKISHQLQE